MNLSEKTIEKQIQFWGLVGPLMVLATLFVLFIKVSTSHLLIPMTAIVGLGLCCKWKMRGLAIALGVLFAIIFYQFSEVSVTERYWVVGITMAIALGFVISALSYEEVEELIASLKAESNSRLENLWKLDEKLKQLQTESKEKITTYKTELYEKEELIEMVQEEFLGYQEKQENLLREVFLKRNEVASLQEQLCQAHQQMESYEQEIEQLKESPKQEEINPQTQKMIEEQQSHIMRLQYELNEQKKIPEEAKYQQLRKQFDEKSKILDETRRELFQTKEQLLAIQKDKEETEVIGLNDIESTLEKYLIHMEKENSEIDRQHQTEIEALHELVTSLMVK